MIRLTLYTRTDCHLCDEMHAVIDDVARDFDVALEQIDVDADPTLAATYGNDVPVLAVNGHPTFKHRVDAPTLRTRLAKEKG
ncbi:MAG TPA: glutaredoxin family protein [Candidatus Binatia bacterium]|nr:glutaredoxin family protein [Candidatus Binatia bacterium]